MRRALIALPVTRDLPAFLEDRLGFLDGQAASGRNLAPLRLGWPTYLVHDAEDVEHILIVNHRRYDKTRRLTGRRGRRLVGDALLTRRSESHRRRRRALQPLFHRSAVNAMVAGPAAAAAEEIAAWPAGEWCSASSIVEGLVLRARLRTVFADADESELADLARAVIARQRFLHHVFAAVHPLPHVFPRQLARAYRHSLALLDAAIARRQPLHDRPADLVAMLLEARDRGRPLSARELRDEVVTLALTGYETPAALMVWLLHVLSSHPEVQERAHREVQSTLGLRRATIDDLERLPFLRAVLAETLRLFPPTWIVPRIATRSDRLPSGLEVRAHTKLYLSPWIVHRDPRYHVDPQRFDPDRFTGDWRRTMRRGTYFPFGAGPHVCIGERIAVTETMLFLATVLQRWRLEPGEEPVTPEPEQTLRPRDGLRLRLDARQSSPVPAS